MPSRNAKRVAYENSLHDRVGSWSAHGKFQSLAESDLRRITQQEGVDFATALLFDRLLKSSERAQFIERINTLRQFPPNSHPKIDAKIVIVPGALYLERPDLGGNGRVIREVAAAFGLQTEIIPLASFGSVATNAGLIRSWLAQHSQERIILVSLSKGGADLKLALSAEDAPGMFGNVPAWINVCGPLNGSAIANWILANRMRAAFVRWKFRWQNRDFQFITDLRHGEGSRLNFPPRVPASMRLVTLIGFPLRHHFTTRFSRFCHRILAASGPNDGTTLLSDLQTIPGDIYPAWGMDHYFHPVSEAKSLVAAVLHYLAEKSPGVLL